SKIKEDVRKRNMNPDYDVDEYFSENEKEYVYTDKILESNLGELKSWIYSYGSSMVVEKPETLRKQIIESYQKRKDYY
nr:WYL domain-containing protein [Eubacterium sp.]